MQALIIDKVYNIPQHTPYSVAEAFKHSLEELGIQAKVLGPRQTKRHPVVDLAFYFILTYHNPKYIEPKGKVNIFCHLEPLPRLDIVSEKTSSRWQQLQGLWQRYAFLNYIFDPSSTNVEFLQAQGYPAIYCPWGYSPIFESKLKAYPNWDVSLVGNKTPYRDKGVNFLTRNGVSLLYYGGLKESQQIVQHSKINLNIHSDKLGTFESGRVVCLIMSNGGFVVTEPYDDQEVPLENKKHLVICNIDEMPDIIQYYLKNDEERKSIAISGQMYVKQNYTMTQNLKQALIDAILIDKELK